MTATSPGLELNRRWLVAGTAGGVGTTTVTALLFAAARERLASVPVLLDHTDGRLGPRLPDGDLADTVDPRWTLHDLGPHAAGAGSDALADPRVCLVLVSAATPAGCALAAETLTAIAAPAGSPSAAAAGTDDDPSGRLGRTVVVLAGTFGRHRIGRETAALTAVPGLRGLQTLPVDPVLGAGGRIPLPRVARRTRRALEATLDLLLH